MLDDDVSACGGNRLLLDARHKFLTFFDVGSLPNAAMLGHQHMTLAEYTETFPALRDVYHNVSEKRIGELVALSREDIAGLSEPKKSRRVSWGCQRRPYSRHTRSTIPFVRCRASRQTICTQNVEG